MEVVVRHAPTTPHVLNVRMESSIRVYVRQHAHLNNSTRVQSVNVEIVPVLVRFVVVRHQLNVNNVTMDTYYRVVSVILVVFKVTT